jgi:hypothetical protein
MEKPFIVVDGVEREMTDAEFVVYQKDQADFEARQLAKQAADKAKAALLERLGITEDEAKLLLS